jgi:hypothetical protein
MKTFKDILYEAKLNNAVQKIIKLFHLNKRPNDPRDFYERSGVGNYEDYKHIKKISPDFKIVAKSDGLAWMGFSEKDLFEVSYIEGDIRLTAFNNIKELEKAKEKGIKFAKENW